MCPYGVHVVTLHDPESQSLSFLQSQFIPRQGGGLTHFWSYNKHISLCSQYGEYIITLHDPESQSPSLLQWQLISRQGGGLTHLLSCEKRANASVDSVSQYDEYICEYCVLPCTIQSHSRRPFHMDS